MCAPGEEGNPGLLQVVALGPAFSSNAAGIAFVAFVVLITRTLLMFYKLCVRESLAGRTLV